MTTPNVLGAIAAIQLRDLSKAVDNQIAFIDWKASSEIVRRGAIKCRRITITLECDPESYPRALDALAKPVTDQD